MGTPPGAGATPSSIEPMGASGSYATRIKSSASNAASSSTAATAATGSPTKRTRSVQSACSSCETGRMPNGVGSSFPVAIATTPGAASAAETSMERMRACATFERRSLQWSIRGRTRSSAKRVCPVTLAAPSTRR
jgi:hypothetical protein